MIRRGRSSCVITEDEREQLNKDDKKRKKEMLHNLDGEKKNIQKKSIKWKKQNVITSIIDKNKKKKYEKKGEKVMRDNLDEEKRNI